MSLKMKQPARPLPIIDQARVIDEEGKIHESSPNDLFTLSKDFDVVSLQFYQFEGRTRRAISGAEDRLRHLWASPR